MFPRHLLNPFKYQRFFCGIAFAILFKGCRKKTNTVFEIDSLIEKAAEG
jgi:hypothetical protein